MLGFYNEWFENDKTHEKHILGCYRHGRLSEYYCSWGRWEEPCNLVFMFMGIRKVDICMINHFDYNDGWLKSSSLFISEGEDLTHCESTKGTNKSTFHNYWNPSKLSQRYKKTFFTVSKKHLSKHGGKALKLQHQHKHWFNSSKVIPI